MSLHYQQPPRAPLLWLQTCSLLGSSCFFGGCSIKYWFVLSCVSLPWHQLFIQLWFPDGIQITVNVLQAEHPVLKICLKSPPPKPETLWGPCLSSRIWAFQGRDAQQTASGQIATDSQSSQAWNCLTSGILRPLTLRHSSHLLTPPSTQKL